MTMIIAFAGRKQSGKTTCSNFLAEVFKHHTQGKIEIYNFADPLKMLCMDILGLDYSQCYGSDEQKNEIVNCYWDNHQLTAREVLQIVGTDIFRRMQENVWAASTIRKIDKEQPDIAIIGDCRFPNEVEAVKQANGLVIKLTRNPYNSSHDSETALDSDRYDESQFDMVLKNDSLSIEEQNNILSSFFYSKGLLPL
jgi:energy-coupling factor transporter ATP-binding protein EcfA2